MREIIKKRASKDEHDSHGIPESIVSEKGYYRTEERDNSVIFFLLLFCHYLRIVLTNQCNHNARSMANLL